MLGVSDARTEKLAKLASAMEDALRAHETILQVYEREAGDPTADYKDMSQHRLRLQREIVEVFNHAKVYLEKLFHQKPTEEVLRDATQAVQGTLFLVGVKKVEMALVALKAAEAVRPHVGPELSYAVASHAEWLLEEALPPIKALCEGPRSVLEVGD